MDYAEAIAYLDAHINYDRTGRIESPTLERMQRLMAVMGDPQHTFPVIHITGTNGKGSTVAIISRLLSELGLSVGTFTSPHLERINERIGRNGLSISDEEFAEMIAGVADVEVLAGVRPSHFELLTAAAYRWFSDVAVDVAVIEVGLLGRWDATNVADGKVAVVTERRTRSHRVRRTDARRHRRREGGHHQTGFRARARRDRARTGGDISPWQGPTAC